MVPMMGSAGLPESVRRSRAVGGGVPGSLGGSRAAAADGCRRRAGGVGAVRPCSGCRADGGGFQLIYELI